MALENVRTLSDPPPPSDGLAPLNDETPQAVHSHARFESGFAPAQKVEDPEVSIRGFELAVGMDRMDSALTGVTRTEANLRLLQRGLVQLASGASAAHEANHELMQELDVLRSHLTRSCQEQEALRFRVEQLQQLLEISRHEAARERHFLIEQQDSFLVEILTDHERQLAAAYRLPSPAAARGDDAEQIADLTLQRDQAREYATRCERERDLAWQELASAQPNSPAPPTVPPPTLPRTSSATAAGAIPSAGSDGAGGTQHPGATPIAAIHLRSVQVPVGEDGNGPETERSSERLKRP